MGQTRQDVIYLTFQEILEINRQVILRSGGFVQGAGMQRVPGSIEYLVEAIQGNIFGCDLYPTLAHKAALYLYEINAGHVFLDGNKRTAMLCCLAFIRRNGYRISASLTTEIIIETALAIATRQMSYQDIVSWVEGIVVLP